FTHFCLGSVDTRSGQVDTSPRFQKTQLPDWDSRSTLDQRPGHPMPTMGTISAIPEESSRSSINIRDNGFGDIGGSNKIDREGGNERVDKSNPPSLR
ncbi:hypothetical protein Taro_040035, partial [Colocasia esculenta]|nr:hypothetical protein [Colocasia esculenta]